jgi:hypothetical protein
MCIFTATKTRGRALIVLVISAIVLSACPNEPTQELEIRGIGWVYENIDTSYWSDGFDLATCFAHFTIAYSGDSVDVSDIEYARWHQSGDQKKWNFPIDEYHVDTTNGLISSDLWYSTDIASNGSAFPIGTFVFEIGLADGYTTSYTFDVPAPGQTVSGGSSATYNEDYTGTVYPTYVPMVSGRQEITGRKAIVGV